MKAIVYTQYGPPEDVLQLQNVAKPVPKPDQVLIEVQAASVNAIDWRMVRADPFFIRFGNGLSRPAKHTIPGADVAGRIVEVGANVTRLKVGDEVFGDLANFGSGGFAEYVCAPEPILAHKPTNWSFEDAAAVPLAAVTALRALRDEAKVTAGQHVLVQGAGGGVGTYAVQIAKALGARVTAVCGPGNVELMKTLGADRVVDYTREDWTQIGERYDVILGVNGFNKLSDYRRALQPNGRYIAVGGTLSQVFQAMLLGPLVTMGSKKRIGIMVSAPSAEHLQVLIGMADAGQLKPIISRRYPLAETAEALHHVATGHAQGKVVITVK